MADGTASKAARRDLRDKTRQGHRTTTKRAFAFQLPTANKRQRLAAGEDDDQYHDDDEALDNGASAPSPPPSPAQLGIGVPTSLSPATPITYRPRRSPGTSRTTPTSADPVTPQLSFQSIEDASPIPPPTVSHAVASLLPPLPATTRATSIRVQHPPPAATSTSTSSTTKRPYKRRDQSTATATATPLPIDIDEPLSGPLQSRRQMASRRGGFDVIAPHLTSTIDAYRFVCHASRSPASPPDINPLSVPRSVASVRVSARTRQRSPSSRPSSKSSKQRSPIWYAPLDLSPQSATRHSPPSTNRFLQSRTRSASPSR